MFYVIKLLERSFMSMELLKSLPNQCKGHRVSLKTKECSFLGSYQTPDYCKLTIEMIPNAITPELKSVKLYLRQFRNVVISYEHLLNTIFNDFMAIYNPKYLYVRLHTSVRGGISSVLELSSS